MPEALIIFFIFIVSKFDAEEVDFRAISSNIQLKPKETKQLP